MRSYDRPCNSLAGLYYRDIIAVFAREKRIGMGEFHHAIELFIIPVTLPRG
jgi:hypothetical protein